MRVLFISLLLAFCIAPSLQAQDPSFPLPAKKPGHQGQAFFYWGWNRGNYSHSDIHFTGKSYDFTLEKVEARDRQTPFSANKYLNPKNLTIPQTNFRMGYFISDHYAISLGFDHMKYVMVPWQEVHVHGYIRQTDTKYDGDYDHSPLVLSPSFLQYEHTDGLNYINAGLERRDELYKLRKDHKASIVALSLSEGFDAGILMPRTDATLLGFKRHNNYHVSGYGLSVKAAATLTFFEHFFVQGELKGGFINMPDVLTTESLADRAGQHFFFLQRNVSLGAIFRLIRPKQTAPESR